MPDNILSCRDLNFTYGDKQVFENASAEFEQGSFNHIRGPSGSGKSTLFKLFNRLEQPDSGDLLFRGKPLSSYSPPHLRRMVCYIQQTPTTVPGTVLDNLLLPFRFKINRDLHPPEASALNLLLEDFGLGEIPLSDQASNLSGGQKQRLCLLRSLLTRPEVLLLDEPVSALDIESRESVQKILCKLNSEMGVTVLLASHQSFRADGINMNFFEILNYGLLPRQDYLR